MHGRVEVLALDRDQPGRPEQQVVDLASPVAISAQKDPVVPEHPAQLLDDMLLAGYPGGKLFLRVGRWRHI